MKKQKNDKKIMNLRKFLNRWKNYRKSLSRRVRPIVMSPFSMPCAYRCPVCNSQLRTLFGNVYNYYICRKCGYSGPVFVKPEKKKKKTR